MFQTGVFWAFLNFPSRKLLLSQLFWNMLQAWNSKWVNIYKKTTKLISLKIKYLVFVMYSIEYRLKRISKSLYPVFIYVLHNVQTSLELGLYIVASSTGRTRREPRFSSIQLSHPYTTRLREFALLTHNHYTQEHTPPEKSTWTSQWQCRTRQQHKYTT